MDYLGQGRQVCICVQIKHVANQGIQGYALPGNFDFGPFIRHTLVESGTVFAQHNLPFIVSLN